MLKKKYVEDINNLLKNDKGEYQFWFHPEMGYTTNENEIPSDHKLKSFCNKDPIVIVDNIEKVFWFNNNQYINELNSISDKLEKAKYYLALLYWESTLTTYVNFCWRLPNNAFPYAGFKGRCSTSALRNFALTHRAETPFLDLHRYGIRKFLKNFKFYFAGLLGLNPDMYFGNKFNDDDFLNFLVHANVISASKIN